VSFYNSLSIFYFQIADAFMLIRFVAVQPSSLNSSQYLSEK